MGYQAPSSPVKARRLADGAGGSRVYSLAGEGCCQARLELLLPPIAPTAHPKTAAWGGATPGAGADASSSGSGMMTTTMMSRTVLYVSRRGSSLHAPRMGLSSVEQVRVEAIRAMGFHVALLDPCGFGTLGNGNRTTCTISAS